MSTITKALSLLDLFTEARPVIGLSAFQKLTGWDKATVYRQLRALEQAGFLEQTPTTRAYRLGHAVARLAEMRQRTVSEAETLNPIVEEISRSLGERVHVNRLVGDGLHQVTQADFGRHAIRVEFEPNLVLPLLTTSSGKAILAFLPAARRAALIKAPQDRIDTAPMPSGSDVQAALAQAAKVGYAQSRDSFEMGVASVAIPLFDAQGAACAACSVVYPTIRHDSRFLARAVSVLCAQGPGLVARLGGQIPSRVQQLWQRSVPDIPTMRQERAQP
ncbi:MAG: IclR family transcriptional regulator [Oceanicola sp.]|nr:IclR family transcriptional regulator [Oceanicola sp.]